MEADTAQKSNNGILDEVKATFRLGWPIVGAQLLWMSMFVVDNIMVGQIGKEALGSLAIAASLVSFISTGIIGILAAVSPMVSQAFGAEKHSEIGVVVRHALALSLLFSLVEIGVYWFSEPLMVMLGQDPVLSMGGQDYLRAFTWGVPAKVAFICLRHFTEGTSDSIPSIAIAAIGSIVNAIFNYALIFGNWGFPALGLAGAGHSTSAVHWLITLTMVGYIFANKNYQKFEFFKVISLDLRRFWDILVLGVPMGAAILCELSFFVSTTFLAGLIGIVPLASHQIALTAASFTFMAPLGLSFAVCIRVAQAMGRGDLALARTSGTAGIILGASISFISALVFLAIPEVIVGFYTSEPDVIALAVTLLRVAGIFQLFDSIQVCGMGMLRGLKESKVPFINTMIAFWVIGFPLALLTVFEWEMGAIGLWIGMLVGLGLAAIAHLVRFYRVTKAPPQIMG